MTIDFRIGSTLSEAVKWVYSPAVKLTQGSPLRFIRIKQHLDYCTVTGYGAGDVWMQARIESDGIVESEFLIDGEDLLNCVNKQNIWKKSPVRLSPTESNVINFEYLQKFDAEGRPISLGNITIGSFGGDLAEFKTPEREWKSVATITDVWGFKRAASYCSTFSNLRSDSLGRAVYFRFDKYQGSVCATEKGGQHGYALIKCDFEISSTDEIIKFGIEGKYLLRVADVFAPDENNDSSISVYFSYDEAGNPNRVVFFGNKASIDLPIIEDYQCQALSLGAMSSFFNEGDLRLKKVCSRNFDLKILKAGVEIQVPKKKAKTTDTVLEVNSGTLVISKRSDIKRSEKSLVPLQDILNLDGEWTAITIEHSYLNDSLAILQQYLSKIQKFDIGFELDEDVAKDFGFDEDEEPQLSSTVISISQHYIVGKSNRLVYLYLKPANEAYQGCVVRLIAQPKEFTNDLNEAD